MKDPQWLALAKALPAGRSTRVQCCSNDKSMLVTNSKHGYRGHCFRCDHRPFVSHGLFSIEQLQRRKAELALMEVREVRLPSDFTTDIPSSEAIWLYRAGVGHQLAKHYGFGYSAALRRVVLPVFQGGRLAGFTARSTINERPKYIEKVAAPAATIFAADPTVALPSAADWQADAGPSLVLTEDILSAVRVGRLVRACVSLLGTSLSDGQASAAIKHLQRSSVELRPHGRICVWLDPDAAGQRAAKRIVRSLSLQGYDVRNVVTDKDPKLYSNREIRSILTYD